MLAGLAAALPCPDDGVELVADLAADLLAGVVGAVAALAAGFVAVVAEPGLAPALTALAGALTAGLPLAFSAGNSGPEANEVATGLLAAPVAGVGRVAELGVADLDAALPKA